MKINPYHLIQRIDSMVDEGDAVFLLAVFVVLGWTVLGLAGRLVEPMAFEPVFSTLTQSYAPSPPAMNSENLHQLKILPNES